MKSDPNGPAFPQSFEDETEDGVIEESRYYGLTKREWMATKILAQMSWGGHDIDARDAIERADALIAALNAEQKEKVDA